MSFLDLEKGTIPDPHKDRIQGDLEQRDQVTFSHAKVPQFTSVTINAAAAASAVTVRTWFHRVQVMR